MNVTSTPNPRSEADHRPPALTHGVEADALLDEVREAMGTLAKLLDHSPELGARVTLAIQSALDEVADKIDRRELRVAVIGEQRSGKSTFIDALLGERMLGMAKTPPNVVTTVRFAHEPTYRARLRDGFIDDFARRTPDRSAVLAEERAKIEARLADAKRRNVTATVDLAAAADRLERVQTTVTEAFRALETARADAEVWGAKLASTQQTWGRLCAETTERANLLPLLLRRPAPAWWAIGSWVTLFVLFVLYWPHWQKHRAVLRASGKAEAEVDVLRTQSSSAAERCGRAEADIVTANVPVEEARAALEASRRVQREAETECAALERELSERRAEIEREQDERRRHFLADVMALSNIDDRGRDVVDLEIAYPARFLPEDIALLEAPGLTSEDVTSSERSWRAVRDRADACIVVSELGRAVSGETQKFLHPLREAVPHAVLVLTKMDEASVDGPRNGNGDAAERVEQARRIGTRRFAREIGRDASTVLSIAVAAEEALREEPSSEPDRRRFEADVAKLFTLLRYERALILGASSAGIVRRCIRDLDEAKERAAHEHRERIATLEAQRIPDPERFYADTMASVAAAIDDGAKSVVASARRVLRENVELAKVACKTKIAGCATKRDLSALAPELADITARGLGSARDAVRTELGEETERCEREIERNVLQALRERYYILHEITRPADLRMVVDVPLAVPSVPDHLGARLADTIRSFDRTRIGLALGGAATGAGVGSLIRPGLGSAAGALVGGLAMFAKSIATLKQGLAAVVDDAISGLEQSLAEQIEAAESSIGSAIRAALGKSLEHALARFAPFINEPIEQERLAIESERKKLDELEAIGARLVEHDAHLESLIQRARDVSVGLCQ